MNPALRNIGVRPEPCTKAFWRRRTHKIAARERNG